MARAEPPAVGMVLKGYPRISETFISNEILLLERLGIRVHIISMRQPRESFAHASVHGIQAPVDYLPETILTSLHRLLYHNLALALDRPRRYGQTLKAAFRRFLRSRKSATIKHLLQAGLVVHKVLPDSGVVHLHAHFAHSPTSVTMFSSMLSGLPFSFTAHAKDIYTSDPAQIAEKIHRARFVVTCTGYNQEYLTRLAPRRAGNIHRSYHGIDTCLFNRRQVRIEAKPPYRLLTVARLTPKKGLPTLLRALRGLLDRGVEFRHTLIGDGDERARVLRLTKDLGLTHCCRWQGTLPHERVLDHYRRADLFVLGCEIAEDGDRDGIPNVLMESMAMGVPVVTTRVSAIPELVEDGVSGLLVEPREPDALADAVWRMLSDPELRRRVIANGRRKIETDFDNRRLIEKLASLMRAAVDAASSSSVRGQRP